MTMHAQPQDLDAEAAVIGGCLMSADALESCREVLTAGDFYRPAHAMIWSAMLDVAGAGDPVDTITTADCLQEQGLLDRAGGHAGLHDAVQAVPITANAEWYAHIVAEVASRRRLIEYATGLAQAASEGRGDVDALIAEAGSRLDSISSGRNRVQLTTLAETVTATMDRIQAGDSPYQPSPWADLDNMINGWGNGTLNVIAARPGGGKSILGLQAALMAARSKAVTYAVMEMDHDEVNIRLLSQSAHISMGSLVKRDLTEFQWRKINKVAPDLMSARLYVDPAPRQTIDHIRAHARAASRTGDLGMIVVDYLQQVRPPQSMTRSPRYEQVGHTAAELKALAREFGVPVLAMVQAKRTEPPRAPSLSDLRESGNIEADADTVIGLHRSGDDSLDLECHVLKARQGRTGQCLLGWQSEYAKLLPIGEARGWETA